MNKVRFVTAASLFDGHDASINIMRRILQASGCEVIHLGHNRSVEEIVDCALQEDAHGIAISSYQGGHVEFFKYMIDLLRERGAGHVKVFGGGGGVIVPDEIRELHDYGVARIFSPEDGQKLGLQGMINEIVAACDTDLAQGPARVARRPRVVRPVRRARATLARIVTGLEAGSVPAKTRDALLAAAAKAKIPVLGITGTGGAGKSSLTDELVRRFRLDQDDRLKIAVISIDPSRRKSGGALLGDRIRMNAIEHRAHVYMRSLATRDAGSEISKALPDVIAACKVAGVRPGHRRDLGHRPGRRGDRAARRRVALRDDARVRRRVAAREDRHARLRRLRRDQQVRPQGRAGRAARRAQAVPAQPRALQGRRPTTMPVFGTIASRFNDDGVTALYQAIAPKLAEKGLKLAPGKLPPVATRQSTGQNAIVPPARVRYLAEIAETVPRLPPLGGGAGDVSRASGSSCGGARCSTRWPATRPLQKSGRVADTEAGAARQRDRSADTRSTR